MQFKFALLSALAAVACAAPAATTTADVVVPTSQAEVLKLILKTAELAKDVSDTDLASFLENFDTEKRSEDDGSSSLVARTCVGGTFMACYNIFSNSCALQCYGVIGLGNAVCLNSCFDSSRKGCEASCK